MTVIVTVKINDGIVLACDSATTFSNDAGVPIKIYNSANKAFNLVKGLPIGGLTCGAGGIGSASISTITKDLRRRLSGQEESHLEWKLPPDYTMKLVAEHVRQFLFEELFKQEYGGEPPEGFSLAYKVCGYSAGAALPELWDVRIVDGTCGPPSLLRDQADCGTNWDGELDALSRLLLGVGVKFRELLIEEGVPEEEANEAVQKVQNKLGAPVVLAAMPVQDAIELAKFMVQTTIGFMRFNLGAETVGGPIEIAAITKHEGFKWISRKLFYDMELNP
ncbi:hypothetical protein ACFFWD_03720 [Bradyrhizobium erythrophlei]|uniref:hypothetical protein n=1 Tax=Bradyrhizobium erythrophlei TaxID=1437360 RepID=UPI0035EEFA77